MIEKPKSVLFVCNQNAVRSPMAEALAQKYSKRKIFIESAGLIAGMLDPFTVSVMEEAKISLKSHKAKTLAEIDLSLFDLIIALTPESYERLQKMIGPNAILEYWATPDPSDAEGHRNQLMESYRLVRDHLECRIADRFQFCKAS